MVQEETEEPVNELCDLKIDPLSGVDINNAAARLQSRDSSDDNIFEILPRFSITGGETNEGWDAKYERRRDEVLTVMGSGDVTGISVGCELLAFERNKDEPLKQLHFAASVDFVVWRRSILLVGLSSSEIILVDPSSYSILHTWEAIADVAGNKPYFVDAFIHSSSDNSKIDVIVVFKEGLVCKFREIALSGGSLDATHDQNQSLDLDLGSINDVTQQALDVTSQIACACSPTRNILVVVEEAGNLIIVDLISNAQNFVISNMFFTINPNLQLMKNNLRPKKIVACEGCMFLLLSNGTLNILVDGSPYGSKSQTVCPDASIIHDFTLVRNNNEGTVKLWALYSTKSSFKMNNFVGIFGGPFFQSEFSFQLPTLNQSEQSSLFQFPKNVNPFEEPSSIIEMGPKNINLYHILETSTDVTLQKLLSRGKFQEADDLAKKYNKDLDIVRKAEARDKLSKIAAYFSSNCDEKQSVDSLWSELLEILRKITDAEFVCNFCVQTKLYRVPWVKEILALGKLRISECRSTSAAESLLLSLKKFFTFELVFPSGTINEWKSFISKDNTMFMQCMKFLQIGDFNKCERVWKRHWDEFIPVIGLEEFLPFFNVLFDHQLNSPESVSLLKTILPFAVEKVARSALADDRVPNTEVKELDILILIINRQVSTLEGKIEWPVNALRFIKELSAVVKDEIKRLNESLIEHDKRFLMEKKRIVEQIKEKLDRLEKILDELAELKKNHSIIIPFHDYITNEIPEVINKLLYKLLSNEEVESFVSEYLKPYATSKGLNIDQLFAEHIKSVVQYIHYYIQAINIPHEERIICLVNLISSMRVKLECALLISGEWPVPWTAGIANMVETVLAIPRSSLDAACASLYDQIRMMQKQVPFRCVLNKYKLNYSKLCSRKSYVTMALLKILTFKRPGFLEDSKELLKHIPPRTLTDEVRFDYIAFIIRLYDEAVLIEDAIPSNMQPNGSLRKAIVRRVYIELQNMEANESCDIYTKEEQQRVISIYRQLAVESNDPRDSILGKLKEVLATAPLDVIYNSDFPYACLTSLFEGADVCGYVSEPKKLIDACKLLSKVTQSYLEDMLLCAGFYFTTDSCPVSAVSLLWAIVDHIIKTPLNIDMNNTSENQETLQQAGLCIATTLLLQSPDSSLEQMYSLHEFLCRLSNSFPKLFERIGQLLCFFRIFLNLKEQEIPLESDFLEVYCYLFCDGVNLSWKVVEDKLKTIGETLLRFGENETFFTLFRSLERHFRTLVWSPGEDHDYIERCKQTIVRLEAVKNELWKRKPTILDDEADGQMRKLVTDLNEAGIKVNVYALKIRNKLKLLERLLNLKIYILAAELAITFSYFDNQEIWASILTGLITNGNMNDLKRVLENVSTRHQVWMVPEFAEAWKKVSEVDNSFLELCPISLE